jgi:hypothetical protein
MVILTLIQRYSSFETARGTRDHSWPPVKDNYLDERKVVNVIIAKNFNRTNDEIQLQALEVNCRLVPRFA